MQNQEIPVLDLSHLAKRSILYQMHQLSESTSLVITG